MVAKSFEILFVPQNPIFHTMSMLCEYLEALEDVFRSLLANDFQDLDLDDLEDDQEDDMSQEDDLSIDILGIQDADVLEGIILKLEARVSKYSTELAGFKKILKQDIFDSLAQRLAKEGPENVINSIISTGKSNEEIAQELFQTLVKECKDVIEKLPYYLEVKKDPELEKLFAEFFQGGIPLWMKPRRS